MNAAIAITRTRAPKGGQTIMGVFYRGGQFLPTFEPQKGKWNRKTNKASAKVRKVEIAPYEWVPREEGKQSIFSRIAGTVATMQDDKMVYCGNEKTLAYTGFAETQVIEMVANWNNGERWFASE